MPPRVAKFRHAVIGLAGLSFSPSVTPAKSKGSAVAPFVRINTIRRSFAARALHAGGSFSFPTI
jgi:hypothetical protein